MYYIEVVRRLDQSSKLAIPENSAVQTIATTKLYAVLAFMVPMAKIGFTIAGLESDADSDDLVSYSYEQMPC